MSETTEALIERVLGAHEPLPDFTYSIEDCGCGEWFGPETYAAHVAAAIAEALAEREHTHAWVTRQNVTSRGYQMPPYRVCSCGAAETINEESR